MLVREVLQWLLCVLSDVHLTKSDRKHAQLQTILKPSPLSMHLLQGCVA